MTVYRYDKTLKVGRKEKPKTLFYAVLIVLAIGLAVFLLITRGNDSIAVDGRAVRISNDPYIEFKTGYFRFTVSNSWAEAKDLGNSTDTFVYRKYKQSSPLGVLTVKVNAGAPNLITNVVPVEVEAGKITLIGSISEHCSNFVPAGSNLDPREVSVEEVTFRCWTDGSTYISSVGSRGGNLELSLLRTNGETANYSISYQNTSFDVDKKAILEILKTFEAL